MSSYLKDVLQVDVAVENETVSVEAELAAESQIETEPVVASGPELSRPFTLPANIEQDIRSRMSAHNASYRNDASKFATAKALFAVYRRGASTFNVISRPELTRHEWAMARVNAHLGLLASGRPSNPLYNTDNDLLPTTHPKSPYRNTDTRSEAVVKVREAITAAATVTVLSEDAYLTPEHAIFALAEYSGLGYHVIPSIRAAWSRAESAGQNPFARAFDLASNLYASSDADLLPTRSEEN